jgi:predicted nucleotidyltransferase
MKRKMPEKINKAINEFVVQANKMFGNRMKKIILYGSYARGDFNKSSDIDIMILTDLTDEEIIEYGEKIWDFAYDIQLENDVLLSVLIKNIDTFNYWLEAMPFYMNVAKEGVVLNGR